MGLRFGKRIQLGKYVRLNLSRSGLGVSVGVRGARLSTGKRGARLTLGVPGTGLSYTRQLSGGQRSKRAGQPPEPRPTGIPAPGRLAPQTEKDYVAALNYYLAGQTDQALDHLLALADAEPSAALLAAAILVNEVTFETVIFYGRAMQAQGLDEAAASVFTRALKNKRGRARELLREARYWRAVAYEAQGSRVRARKEFERLYAEAPDFRDVAQRLGQHTS